MATFISSTAHVTVPATSANLGPGFDSLGLALSLRDSLEAEVTDGGLRVEVTGAGAAEVPRDESHLVVRSMRAAFAAMGAEPPGLTLRCTNVIPHGRGLGSSSAAIVGGLSLARALVEGGQLLLDDDSLFRLAADIEGHPDNVAPAFYGGFVIAGREHDEWYAVPTEVDPRIRTVVFVPPHPVETKVARGLLPTEVPHGDAAANSGRAALLVAALTGRPEHLFAATRDYLHQNQREPAMPESLALMHALRSEGIAAVISGAGPTVLAFSSRTGDDLVERTPVGWARHELHVEVTGVHVGE